MVRRRPVRARLEQRVEGLHRRTVVPNHAHVERHLELAGAQEDLVAFDEVSGSYFKNESEKQMFKGYMEQGSFSRGDERAPCERPSSRRPSSSSS